MRRGVMAFLVLAVCLATAAAAPAGVYHLAEKPSGPAVGETGAEAIPFDLFGRVLAEQRELRREEPPSKLRQHYLKKRDELQAKVRSDSATIDDKINLSAYLIGLGQPAEAAQVLELEARGVHRSHFLVLANLATAYFQTGLFDRAFEYQSEALSNWPKQWPGFTPQQLAWFKEVERKLRLLMVLRRKEQTKQPPGTPNPSDQVDNLFDVEFTGESGRYEAGQMAKNQKAKLPGDALAQVQQLVLWLPGDDRLFWLLGELYNTEGKVNEAFEILNECVSNTRRYNSSVLREHRLALDEERQARQAAQSPAPPSWLPETWKIVVVAGGLVALVLVFGSLQLREMNRRRARRAST